MTLLPSRRERGKFAHCRGLGSESGKVNVQGRQGESERDLKGQLWRRLMELASVDLLAQGEGSKVKRWTGVEKNLKLIPSLLWIPQ